MYAVLCCKQKTLVGLPLLQGEGLTILQRPVITHQSTRPNTVPDETSGTENYVRFFSFTTNLLTSAILQKYSFIFLQTIKDSRVLNS